MSVVERKIEWNLADATVGLVDRSDVLLPMTFYLVTIHEHDFEVQARKELGSDAKEDALVLRAFALADAEFDRGSVTKAGKRIAWP